jgi:hypothetical protein
MDNFQYCIRCKQNKSLNEFARTRSPFFPNKRSTICNNCATDYLVQHDFSWDAADDLCRWLNIPFIVSEWQRIVDETPPESVWKTYSTTFAADAYESLGWKDYHLQYLELKKANEIELELPLLHEEKLAELARKWGDNYDENELFRLEDLYKGLVASQNVNGALQVDQAEKICKLSLEIDSRIRSGDKDVDKFLSSYEKLIKGADFTPRNAKNSLDFDSASEMFMWLEQKGLQNQFYDNITRDVIDESMKTFENYNQRLYTNEGGIGDEITQRIQNLSQVNDLSDSIYGVEKEYDLEEFDNEVYKRDAEADFEPEVDT